VTASYTINSDHHVVNIKSISFMSYFAIGTVYFSQTGTWCYHLWQWNILLVRLNLTWIIHN